MKLALSVLSSALLLGACAHKSMDKSEALEPKTFEAAPAAEMAVNDAAPMMDVSKAITQIMAGSHRDPKNVARDGYRHPAETLAFFGIKPDMTVVEVTPGAGWYAEILAPLLHDHGTYIVAPPDASKAASKEAQEYYGKGNDALEAKFAAGPGLYDNVKTIYVDTKAVSFGAAGSADMVLTFRNVHNWVGGKVEGAMFKGFYEALKPGGVLGVVEHRADAGKPENPKSGYMREAAVIAIAEAAGFKLEEKSEINANPKDTKDYPGGVWTLPPTLGEGEKDKAKYLAIGESDRMTLRFRKPL
jgi:predicted methyltransferase